MQPKPLFPYAPRKLGALRPRRVTVLGDVGGRRIRRVLEAGIPVSMIDINSRRVGMLNGWLYHVGDLHAQTGDWFTTRTAADIVECFYPLSPENFPCPNRPFILSMAGQQQHHVVVRSTFPTLAHFVDRAVQTKLDMASDLLMAMCVFDVPLIARGLELFLSERDDVEILDVRHRQPFPVQGGYNENGSMVSSWIVWRFSGEDAV